MKGEFQRILEILDSMSNSVEIGGVGRMTSKDAGSIKYALQKQLDYVKFFREKDDCKKAGGSIKVQTLSDKNVIAKHKLYEN